jgi:outer membrane receptor protein involved in Fe transport
VNKTNKERLIASTVLAGLASLGVPLGLGAVGSMAVATDALAQDYTTGAIRGRVFDQDGNPVSGANVTVTSETQGFSRNTTTNANGEFTVQVLPIGDYTASISASGYSPTESRDLRVEAGGSTVYAFDLVSGGGDEIVVTAARAQLSFNETTTGLQLNVQELTERVPVGQNVLSLALLAPSAVQGGASNRNVAFAGQPAIGGASVAENAFFINGLNITNFENGFGGATVPFEFYQTVEVKTGGYQAEFGRSTGAVINATTKSGSNDWMLRLSGSLDPLSMQEQQPRTLNDANEFDTADRQIATLEIGGPIWEDRLFFYVLGQHRDIENEFASITGASFNVDRTDDPFYAAKVDFNITDDHRIEGTYFDTSRDTARSVRAFTPSVGSGGTIGAVQPGLVFQEGGESYVFRYTGSFTDWFTLSAGYGNHQELDHTLPENTSDPRVDDTTQGNVRISSQTAFSTDLIERSREFMRVDADFFFDLMGEHHVRGGWDREELTLVHTNERTGGFSASLENGRADDPGTPAVDESDPYGILDPLDRYAIRTIFESGGSFNQTNEAYYLQDSWDVLDNLTLNLGVRLDKFDLNNAAGQLIVAFEEEVAPRLGFSWDPGNDGTNRIFGSYGRYFLPIAANTAFRNGASELFFNEILQISEQGTPGVVTDDYDATTGLPIGGFGAPVTGFAGAALCPAEALNPGALACEVFGDGTANLPITYIDQQLESTYEDEFILGWEHRFDNDWTIGITAIWQTLGRVSEDVAIDRAVREYCAANFTAAQAAQCAQVWDGQHQYSLTNPGEDLTIVLDGFNPSFTDPDDLDNIFEELDGETIDLSADALGYPKPQRDYYGVTFDFERPWDGQWMLQGSYTWSISEGNYEGQAKSDNGQDDVGITTDFDLLGLVDGAYGHLPNHREHQFKVFGAYGVTEAFTVGANVTVQSPREFGCMGRHPTDTDAADYGATSWYCQGVFTPRASITDSDWLTQVDLSFRYSLDELLPGNLTLRADVFNVFNSDAMLSIEERGDNTNGSVRNLPTSTFPVLTPAYGYPTSYQTARFVRLGFAWEF